MGASRALSSRSAANALRAPAPTGALGSSLSVGAGYNPNVVNLQDPLDALRRVVETAHRHWRRRLSARTGGWDRTILTAANERQARGYRLQMAQRAAAGTWPPGRPWCIIPDPDGRRIGTGLATLNALRDLGEDARRGRTLILHCGGSSIRMPHASAFGKIFVPLPVPRAAGRASTVFDEDLALLETLAEAVPEGTLTAAGDVLVALSCPDVVPDDRVTVFTVPAPVDAGEGHGVFLAERPDGPVRRILQKRPSKVLRREGAVDGRGRVMIDTGLFYLPPAFTEPLCAELDRPGAPLAAAVEAGVPVDLYTDLAEALAADTRRADYLAAADGLRREVRAWLWERLHGRFALHVRCCEPGAFFHLGSTAAYVAAMAPGSEVGRVYGFRRSVAGRDPAAGRATFIACGEVDRRAGPFGEGAVVEGCRLGAGCRVGAGALAGGLDGGARPFAVADGRAAFAVPLALPKDFRVVRLAGRSAWAVALCGVRDNPKVRWDRPGATFQNVPFAEWLSARGIAPNALWPAGARERTLWTARLFPVEMAMQPIGWLDWFQAPAARARERTAEWRAAPRVALWEMFESADCERLAVGSRTGGTGAERG